LKRRQEIALASIHLDRDAATALYRQLWTCLRQAILSGSLVPGSRLPSTRELARKLRISRNTVANAYEILWTEGLLESRVGSGTRVRSATRVRTLSKPLSIRSLLRDAMYPGAISAFDDPDGNPLYITRG
jgi:GntR family transcriptional regulator/MocR family aminotransferase